MKKKKAKNSLHLTLAIMAGLFLGIVVGFLVPLMPAKLEHVILPVVNLIGGIYMSALNMVIYPMVFCSIVMGIWGIGSMGKTGKIGGGAMLYFICTTAIASAIGLIVPRMIELGKGVSIELMENDSVHATEFSSLLDTIKNLLPSNPIAAFANGNMLQVLAFAVVVGFACLSIRTKAEPFIKVVDSLNEICMKIITVVMYFTPIGVFCTIVPVVYNNGLDTIVSLAMILGVLYIAFFAYALIVYGAAVKVLGKVSPKKFFVAILPAAMNAFGTCSSTATIPISKRCCEVELGISSEVTSLAIPLGATVNMDAVSILMSFMIMFFANACGVEVSLGQMIIVLCCNVLLSVGTPGVPGGAIASFAALASVAGLPAGVMGVYVSINTLCDMGATCVNAVGDMSACAVLQEKLKAEL